MFSTSSRDVAILRCPASEFPHPKQVLKQLIHRSDPRQSTCGRMFAHPQGRTRSKSGSGISKDRGSTFDCARGFSGVHARQNRIKCLQCDSLPSHFTCGPSMQNPQGGNFDDSSRLTCSTAGGLGAVGAASFKVDTCSMRSPDVLYPRCHKRGSSHAGQLPWIIHRKCPRQSTCANSLAHPHGKWNKSGPSAGFSAGGDGRTASTCAHGRSGVHFLHAYTQCLQCASLFPQSTNGPFTQPWQAMTGGGFAAGAAIANGAAAGPFTTSSIGLATLRFGQVLQSSAHFLQ